MKKLNLVFGTLLAFTMLLTFTACGPKDASIKEAVEKAISADMEGATVSVEKGIVTISGMCKDEACNTKCMDAIKGIKGVKDVVNNCEVKPAPAPELRAVHLFC